VTKPQNKRFLPFSVPILRLPYIQLIHIWNMEYEVYWTLTISSTFTLFLPKIAFSEVCL